MIAWKRKRQILSYQTWVDCRIKSIGQLIDLIVLFEKQSKTMNFREFGENKLYSQRAAYLHTTPFDKSTLRSESRHHYLNVDTII